MASDTVGQLKIGLSFDTKELNTSMQSAETSASKTGTAIQTALGVIAANAIQATIGKVGDLARSVLDVGMDFDSTMSQVAAISGASGEDLAALTAKAQEMGATTKFTATEAAQGLTYMAMAGWDAQAQIAGLPGIMNLAAAGGADLAITSDIVTDALTAFGEAADQSGRLADIMAAASSNSNTNIELLGETFKYVAPVAGALSYSMEDTAVAIGLMANAGIKGSQAGTALRTLLTNLTKPTESMAAAMDELGISITDANGEMKPMSQLTDELREAFSGLSEAEQASYAATIAGKEGMSGLLAIVNAAPADYDKLTEAINGSNGAAQTMADTMLDNLDGKMTLLSSAIDGVKLAIYNGFLPPLTEGAEGLSGLVTAISDVVSGTGNAQAGIQSFVDSFGSALVGGISSIGKGIGKVVPVLVQAIVGIFPDLLQGVMSGIANMVTEIAASLPDMLTAIVDSVIGIVYVLTSPENIQMFIQAGLDLLMGLVEAIPQVITVLAERIPEIINNIVQSLILGIPMLIEGAIQFFHAIIDAIPMVVVSLVNALPQILDTILTYLLAPETIEMLFMSAIELLTTIILAIPEMIMAMIPVLPDILSTIIGYLLDPATLSQLLNAATQLFLQLVLAVPKILGQLVKAFGDLVGKLWENIKTMFGKFAENFGTFITDIFKGAINGMLTFIENFINTPINILNGFIGIINDAFGWLGVSLGSIPLVQLPRLQYGGIIPGDDYSGDHVIARVNSGEMVLTRGQQGALWNAIESGNFGQVVEPAMPEPATADVDVWVKALAQAFADTQEATGEEERPLELTQYFEVNSELDAVNIGNIIGEAIRTTA